MNTDVHVIVVGGTPEHLTAAEIAVRDREARWSRFLPDSELSGVNRAAGRPVIVSPDTFHLISDAVDAYHLTGGIFDPTVLGCLLDAGYDRSFELIDDPGAGPIRAAPGPEGIELDVGLVAVRLPVGVGLDLGGLGKGATADVVTDELLAAGVAGCCVNIGGDIRVRGEGPENGGWVVELACPGSSAQRWISLGDGAVCTSTTLKRRWGSSGQQHHLRDPATGRPLDTGLVSVSVIAERALQADVLTKVALAAGPEAAAPMILEQGATGLLVADDGAIVALDGLENFLLTIEAGTHE